MHKSLLPLMSVGIFLMPATTIAETTQAYSSVRGWQVDSIYDHGAFIGCRAAVNTRADTWSIGIEHGLWTMRVPLSDPANFPHPFTGGIVAVDGEQTDAQFGFSEGYGVRDVSSFELGVLKQGAKLTVTVNGDEQQSWSLKGSTAAILKVQECNDRGGAAPQAKAQTNTAPPPPSNAAGMQCDSYTTGPYACRVTQIPPDPGYVDSFQVDAVNGSAPSFFFRVVNDQSAEVWGADGYGGWNYLGFWRVDANGCAQPQATQSPEADANLGQDAWGLCVR